VTLDLGTEIVVGNVTLDDDFLEGLKAVVNEVGPPLRYLLPSIVREASERPKRGCWTRLGAEVQYHCTTL
jgi:hypothetical protein